MGYEEPQGRETDSQEEGQGKLVKLAEAARTLDTPHGAEREIADLSQIGRDAEMREEAENRHHEREQDDDAASPEPVAQQSECQAGSGAV